MTFEVKTNHVKTRYSLAGLQQQTDIMSRARSGVNRFEALQPKRDEGRIIIGARNGGTPQSMTPGGGPAACRTVHAAGNCQHAT